MTSSIRKTITAVAPLVALALGGSALADAASNSSTTSSGSSSSQQQAVPPQGGGARLPGAPRGPHVGANGQTEQALTGDTASKVKAAALADVAGGTVERVETDVDFGSPYEAHIRKSDGSEVSVLVDKSFQVTAVKAMPQHP